MVKTLSDFFKTIVKMTPTPNSAVSAGQTLKVCLPRNALEDLRTFTMYSKELVLILNVPPISIVVNNSYSERRFPSSSIIDTVNIYFNGTLIENITEYGHYIILYMIYRGLEIKQQNDFYKF